MINCHTLIQISSPVAIKLLVDMTVLTLQGGEERCDAGYCTIERQESSECNPGAMQVLAENTSTNQQVRQLSLSYWVLFGEQFAIQESGIRE